MRTTATTALVTFAGPFLGALLPPSELVPWAGVWAPSSAVAADVAAPSSEQAYAEFKHRAMNLLVSSVAKPLLALQIQYTAPAPKRLHDEGADDQKHLNAIDSVDSAISRLVRKIRKDPKALVRFIGLDENNHLHASTLALRLKLIEIGMSGTVSPDDRISELAADALVRYLTFDASQPVHSGVQKPGNLTTAVQDLVQVQRMLGKKEAHDVLMAPVMPAVDFTIGILCLVGMIAGAVGAPESGGSSLLVTIGTAATAVSKLEYAYQLGTKISRGKDLSPWDATILMNILPTGEGAQAFDTFRTVLVAGKGIDVARTFDPRKLYNKDPKVRLDALQELVTILQVKTSLGQSLKTAKAAKTAAAQSKGKSDESENDSSKN